MDPSRRVPLLVRAADEKQVSQAGQMSETRLRSQIAISNRPVRLACHARAMANGREHEGTLELIALPAIQKRILVVRDRYVMLDEVLADLYGVETQARLGRHDQQLDAIFQALRQLISPPARPKRPIGFSPPEDEP